MNKMLIIGLLAGALIGVVGTASAVAIMNANTSDESVSSNHSSMSMNDMTAALAGLEGDAFDQAFTEMMIAHHQGAVDMALLAENQAKHEEIKTLSDDIIEAQVSEITQMQQWLKDWGYTNNSSEMIHGGH
jgi:uncharacterized protein (DUF305 family)